MILGTADWATSGYQVFINSSRCRLTDSCDRLLAEGGQPLGNVIDWRWASSTYRCVAKVLDNFSPVVKLLTGIRWTFAFVSPWKNLFVSKHGNGRTRFIEVKFK
jgi:hypothetical protein